MGVFVCATRGVLGREELLDMADSLLESSALSAFCGSIATMLQAGIQTDEAVHMLSENRSESQFKRVCTEVYKGVIAGNSLADSMAATGAFPTYAVEMVAAGESSGRLEPALHNLDHYYDEESRLFQKLRSSVSYPAALLCIMSVILIFTVAVILPVFVNVYENMTGSLTTGSFGFVGASIAIGWIALVITIICTIIVLVTMVVAKKETGRQKIIAVLENLFVTRDAMYQIALSRFTATIATYVSSGINTENAMMAAMKTVTHAKLKEKLQRAYDAMIDAENPRSLVQAFTENDIYEPIYARMLAVGNRSGSLDGILEQLADTYFDDAVAQVDLLLSRIEPALAAFLTITVGGTLISVMIPLIGIMRSIG